MAIPKKVFRSRISVLLIILILAVFLPVSIPIFQNKVYQGMYVLGGSFFLLIFLFTGIRYIISGSKLTWTTGSIDIADIRLVKRTYNPLSAPAVSLKRLSIYKKGRKYPYIFISPAKEQQFIEELKAINPDIDVIVPSDKKGIWHILDWDI